MDGCVYAVDAERAGIDYSTGGDYKLIVGEGGFENHPEQRSRKRTLQLPFSRIRSCVTAPSVRFDADTLQRLWRERESTGQPVCVVVFDEARGVLCAGTVEAWRVGGGGGRRASSQEARAEASAEEEEVILRVRTAARGRVDVRDRTLSECLLRGPSLSSSDPLYKRWEREHAECVREKKGPRDPAKRAHWMQRCQARNKTKREDEDDGKKGEEEEEEEENENEAEAADEKEAGLLRRRRRHRLSSKVPKREEGREGDVKMMPVDNGYDNGYDNGNDRADIMLEEPPPLTSSTAVTRSAAEALVDAFAEVARCERVASSNTEAPKASVRAFFCACTSTTRAD